MLKMINEHAKMSVTEKDRTGEGYLKKKDIDESPKKRSFSNLKNKT